MIWARDPELAEAIDADHRNERYLPGADLHPELRGTSSLGEAVKRADVLVLAVPSHGFRAVLERAAPDVRPWIPIVASTRRARGDLAQPRRADPAGCGDGR